MRLFLYHLAARIALALPSTAAALFAWVATGVWWLAVLAGVLAYALLHYLYGGES